MAKSAPRSGVKVTHGRFRPKKAKSLRLRALFVQNSEIAATSPVFKISLFMPFLQEQFLGSTPLIHVEMETGLTTTTVDRL